MGLTKTFYLKIMTNALSYFFEIFTDVFFFFFFLPLILRKQRDLSNNKGVT